MKLSARNVLKGKVVGVIKGVTTHSVKIDIGHGIVITSSITAEAVKDLKLKRETMPTPSSRRQKSLLARNKRDE